MWIEMISSLSAEVEFTDPVEQSDIDSVESALGRELPSELKMLLRESNGLTDEYGCEFVWPVADILARNREMRESVDFRTLYMSFDPLLFIGDNGGGDLFAFVIEPTRQDIFVWQHESDSRRWVANDLQDYIRRYLAAGGEDWYA
ncbi:SMI1/KNR4 family protein [Streptomyces sp900105245]|uniref:SMI1/KNR4 family protein n=1 Tax=Streptomyces sp. 900105245 TaxID=3154379 RepID=UPI003327F778